MRLRGAPSAGDVTHPAPRAPCPIWLLRSGTRQPWWSPPRSVVRAAPCRRGHPSQAHPTSPAPSLPAGTPVDNRLVQAWHAWERGRDGRPRRRPKPGHPPDRPLSVCCPESGGAPYRERQRAGPFRPPSPRVPRTARRFAPGTPGQPPRIAAPSPDRPPSAVRSSPVHRSAAGLGCSSPAPGVGPRSLPASRSRPATGRWSGSRSFSWPLARSFLSKQPPSTRRLRRQRLV